MRFFVSILSTVDAASVFQPPLITLLFSASSSGYFAATPTGSCQACGTGYWCPGGPQTTPQKTQCPSGLTTKTNVASGAVECIRECAAGSFAPTPTAPCQVKRRNVWRAVWISPPLIEKGRDGRAWGRDVEGRRPPLFPSIHHSTFTPSLFLFVSILSSHILSTTHHRAPNNRRAACPTTAREATR